MIVTKKTKYAKMAPFEKCLTMEAVAGLKREAERAYVSMYELTFVQFLKACNGDFVTILGDMRKPTVLQVYWRKRFEDFKKEFGEMLKNTNVPPTADQQRASEGLPKPTFAENILVFVRQYFGLHSFQEAEQITLGNILIARRDAYNTAMFDRKLERIQIEKMNRK